MYVTTLLVSSRIISERCEHTDCTDSFWVSSIQTAQLTNADKIVIRQAILPTLAKLTLTMLANQVNITGIWKSSAFYNSANAS